MNQQQYLLNKLSEEAGEIVQIVSKCIIFGLYEVNIKERHNPLYPNNRERLIREVEDLLGILAMLQAKGVLRITNPNRITEKIKKVEKWMKYSADVCKTLSKTNKNKTKKIKT